MALTARGNTMRASLRTVVFLLGCMAFAGSAQVVAADGLSTGTKAIENALELYQWRNIGPNKGGRSIAVAGHSGRPDEYYFGATGGGLWKTLDGGTTWRPVTDGQINSSSVGSVAVAPSDPDVVYLGMGEGQLRSNVIQGDGVYKSNDAGKTWQHAGLGNTRVISALRIHPTNPDIVFAAALGDPFAPTADRGVYRSVNGGKDWQRILFKSEHAGAIDIALDSNDPNVLYATLWQVDRKPWRLWSGGDQSGVYKSTDGGDSWVDITANTGLPKGPLGKMAVAVSRADSNRVWLNVEAKEGGLYRSDDAGKSWEYVNGHRDLWQRSFYFMQVRVDPDDRDTVYVLNYILQKSTDGGKTFAPILTRHVDVHDLWIDPENPARMIVADDGGGSVSVNGGGSWTDQKVPTAQMYRVSTTNDFPYHVCGAQQDAYSICVPSRKMSSLLSPYVQASSMSAGYDVYSAYYVGGGENGYVTPHPAKPGIFFAGATNQLDRFDRSSQQKHDVQPHPYLVMGQSASTMAERWNWVYPIVFSPLAPHSLYVGSQHLWRSDDEGQHWQKISPDLTRADPLTLGDSGGPITLDQDGPEIYGTIYTIAPSHHDNAVVWTGSDDGLIHFTRNGGQTWKNVTPPDMPVHTRISFIEASPHEKGTAFVAGNRYEQGDRQPYLWKTSNFGRSWSRLDSDVPRDDFVHAVREDPATAGILYVGTERSVYVSLDNGKHWQLLQRNLPVTRVTSLQVKGNELVVATHGRSFYVLEGLDTLRQLAADDDLSTVRLFKPGVAYRRLIPAKIDFHLPGPAGSVELEILDPQGQPVRTVLESTPLDAGSHRISWDLRYDGATVFDGIILEGPSPKNGPWVAPGQYKARLVVDGQAYLVEFQVNKDPRLTAVSDADLQAQLALALKVRDATARANETVVAIRKVTAEVRSKIADSAPTSQTAARVLLQELETIESKLYQTKNQSPKDKIAFPIQLNNRLSGLLGIIVSGDTAPTDAQVAVFKVLESELSALIGRYESLLKTDMPQIIQHLEGTRGGK